MQAKLKNVHLVGPILKSPIEKLYFRSLFSDERRYRQVILNFLSNSVKFTPSGGEVKVLLNISAISDFDHNVSVNRLYCNRSNESLKSSPDKEDKDMCY